MTHSRDRDDVIDRWLRRAASAPAGPGPNAACLDAEVMAAWADGGLPDAALTAVRMHVADCARCQVLAAVMAKLDPAGTAEVAGTRRPIRASNRQKWLGWLVPLAAAAGAIAIWVLVPRQPPAVEEVATPVAAPAQEAAATSKPAAPKLRAEAAPTDLKRQANEKDQKRETLDARADAQRDRAQAAADPKKADTRALPPPPAAPPPPAPVATNVAQPTPPPPTMAQASAARAAGDPARVGQSGAARGGGGGQGAGGAGQRVAEFAESRLSKEIVSTDDATRWRISGGAVEKSTDSGRTWTPVTTGVKAEFTAGASPSPTTCWLVGRGGVVVLTTDGQKWEPLKFPATTDLSAVRATDSRTATVTTADGREYSTTDGGNTWIRRFPQEN